MRIFNAEGEKVYQEWIVKFCADPKNTEFYDYLLKNDDFSEHVGTLDEPTFRGRFPNKYEMISKYKPFIDDCLECISQDMSEQRRLWDSVAYRLLESICRKDADGNWTPGHPAKYMIWDNGKSLMPLYQRHLIYTPYRFMNTNAEAMRPFFEAADPATGTGFEEEIGARQEFVENPNILALFNRLYVGKDGKPMRGYFAMAQRVRGTRVKFCKPGSIRRLMAVLMQFKNTYDIMNCTPDKMLELLPQEFSDWERKNK